MSKSAVLHSSGLDKKDDAVHCSSQTASNNKKSGDSRNGSCGESSRKTMMTRKKPREAWGEAEERVWRDCKAEAENVNSEHDDDGWEIPPSQRATWRSVGPREKQEDRGHGEGSLQWGVKQTSDISLRVIKLREKTAQLRAARRSQASEEKEAQLREASLDLSMKELEQMLDQQEKKLRELTGKFGVNVSES